jgi:hypothetical protein
MNYLPLLITILFSTSAGLGIFGMIRIILKWQWLKSQKVVWLEITPPLSGKRSAKATEQLFVVLHGLTVVRDFKNKLMGRPMLITCEIIANREKGIRYFVGVEARLVESLEQLIYAYLPSAKATLTTEDMSLPGGAKIRAFKQRHHFGFPIASHTQLEEHDPLTYLGNAMTNLKPGETIRLQYVLRPTESREANMLAHRILGNEDVIRKLKSRSIPFAGKLGDIVSSGLLGTLDLVGEVYHGTTTTSHQSSMRDINHKLDVSRKIRPARTLSTFELERMESMHHKLNQPLFKVSLRAAVVSDLKTEQKRRLGAIQTMFTSYDIPGYQSIKRVRTIFKDSWQQRLFELRAQRHTSLFSAGEIGSLYHFPLNSETSVDNLSTSLSKTLAAPVSLKQHAKLDVVLGENHHHGIDTLIGLTENERERHVYIIGGTGNGKTTMLQYGIVQDMENGKGLAIIDPHGDMAENMLKHIPADRIDDVIYFNPDDISYPIGLNILELSDELSDDELIREKDLITESVISIFRKIFSDDDSGGHRVEYVLRNATQTALTVPDATLFTIFELLNNPGYRKKVVAKLDNQDLQNFWKHELGKAGEMQRVKMTAGITAKIGRFLFSASAKRVLEQPKSTIDFDDIINSGKIFICNFSKGLIGEDTSELFGITVLAKLQLASLRRARIAQEDRKPFYLYVDEFQNFATASFVQMLSESRKYKLFMIMAEQSTSQQKDKDMVNIVLANAGTILSFRTGNPEDEKLILPLFSPFLDPGDIANLAPYNFFAKLSATKSQEPLSGTTLLIEGKGSNIVAGSVIERSRLLYAGARPLVTDDTLGATPAQQSAVNEPVVPSPEDVL